jgi:hypothetical protein
MTRLALFVVLTCLCAACGGASSPASTLNVPPAEEEAPAPGESNDRVTSNDRVADVPGGRVLQGPFASWDEICGALRAAPDGEPAPEGAPERRERCSIRPVQELADGGPFLAMTTYFEGRSFDGNAFLALRTERGWFVDEVPDGHPFGGGLSHHTPSSWSYDPATTGFEDGLLRVISRGGSSSFIPGRGALGSSSTRWTAVTACGVREGVPVCGQRNEIWAETCRVSDEPATPGTAMAPPVGERTCEERGEDIPRSTDA